MANFVIGLTGGIGSGKTTIANIFAQYNIAIIDADIVAREVVAIGQPALIKIKEHFGDEILLSSGELNRTLLREKVFSTKSDKHEANKTWLNNLLHPLIRQSILTQISKAKSDYCLLVAPLLLENNLTYMVDRILVVDVDENTQITRTCNRDNNSIEQIKNIIASQISRKERLQQADDVINNQMNDKVEISAQVSALHQKYLQLAAKKNA